jgi:X-X-X-Leu-X-X-Gly heptad repeat protein
MAGPSNQLRGGSNQLRGGSNQLRGGGGEQLNFAGTGAEVGAFGPGSEISA